MKKHLLVILTAVLLAIISCVRPSYYTYHRGVTPEHINHAEVIPIWMDLRFTPAQRIEIMAALHEWNAVFNGQIILQAEGYFDNGIKGADEKYSEISKTGLGWVFIKVNEDDDLVHGIASKGDIAFVPGLGSHIMIVIGDRVGTRSLKAIVMHEVGHLLGANHVNTPSLMIPNYGDSEYNCIDKITVAQVAGFQRLDFRTLNYCVTPFFE